MSESSDLFSSASIKVSNGIKHIIQVLDSRKTEMIVNFTIHNK